MNSSMDHQTSMVLPEPVFEGSEKRVEVDFSLGSGAPAEGLRALSREVLDELMTAAHCCIVSARSNGNFDAYVLSESSLFVYPTKWVLKTCGTTRLLDSVPRLLEVAAAQGMAATRCKYTRASFLFPEQQPAPHGNFDAEAAYLNTHFGHLEETGQGQAYVLGEQDQGLQWHVYVAGRMTAPVATFNLEMCMTELDEVKAQAFFRNDKFISSARTTQDTGIADLLPGAAIDDYVFEPCGYSMNGIDKHQFITIHITPEKGFSYASVEVSGHMEDLVCCYSLLQKAVNIFKPGKVSIAMSVDNANAPGASSWGTLVDLPAGYAYLGANGCKLACGGRVVYYTLATGLPLGPGTPHSPKTVLHHAASSSNFSSVGVLTVSDVASSAGDASEPASSECDMCEAVAEEPSLASAPKKAVMVA